MADPNSVNPYEQIWKTRDLRALETPLELENKLSSFERGVGRFKEQMKGTGYGLAALASQGVQNVIGENPVTQGITDWGLEGYNETTAKSQPGAMYAPKVAKVEDIKTPSDALEWGAGLLGEQLPLAGSLLLTGGIGGAVARLGANAAVKDIAGAAVGSAVKKGVEQGALKAVEGQLVTDTMRKAASKALLDTTLKGAAVTGFAGTAGLEGGQSFGESVQGGAKPEDAVKTAIAVGGINGALELLAPFVVAKKMGMGEFAKKSIADIISNDAGLSKKAIALATAKELGARGVKGFAQGAAVEGLTEGLQELTSIAGERWAKNNPLFADLTDEDWSRVKNSAAGGLFIGGALGGAGATVSGPEKTPTAPVPVPAPVLSKLDALKTNQVKITEQINEAIKAGDTKKAEELQAIKGIYDLAINKTQEVIPAQEKPAEEEMANGQVQAKTEAPLTEPPVQEPSNIIASSLAQQRLSKVMPQEVKTPEVIAPEVMAEPETETLLQAPPAAPDGPLYSRPLQKPVSVADASKIAREPVNNVISNITFGNQSLVNKEENVTKRTTVRGKEYNFNLYEYDLQDGRKRLVLSAGDPENYVDAGAVIRFENNKPIIEMINADDNFENLGYNLTRQIIKRFGTPIKDESGSFSEIGAKHNAKLSQAESVPVASEVTTQLETEAPITVSEDQALPAASEVKQEPLYSRPLQKPAPTFYSALERATQETKQEKAAPAQWESSLDNMVKKGIVKQEELDWSGTKEWLQEQKEPVTKEALLKHVRDNTLEVQETEIGSSSSRNYTALLEDGRWKIFNSDGKLEREINSNYASTAEEAIGYATIYKSFETETPRNTKWTLPGGENQRELVLTVPSIEPFNTDTTHYGDVGGGKAVAWVRFNDRTDEDGKKTLFVEEIQSKRHQEGREKGYTDKEFVEKKNNVDRQFAELGIEPSSWISEEDFARLPKELQDDWKEVYPLEGEGRVENAPFKQTIAGSGQTLSGWAGLAFKRMLRYAVENGYDKVAWTTGKQQAERYSLTNKVGTIYYIPEGEGIGKGTFIVTRKGQTLDTPTIRPLIEEDNVSPTEIENYIGKELALKLLNSQEKSISGMRMKELSDTDLELGGEGMKGFYDRLLPNEINKYVKKWGAKVDKTQMEFGGESASVHTVEVTPAMRDSVIQGQPLFSKQAGKQKTVTPEMDAEYLAAVERGDMEAAQRMVDAAARAAGYSTIKQYHGTYNKNFTIFDTRRGESLPSSHLGAFFTPLKEYAEIAYGPKQFGGRIVTAYLKLNKPYEMTWKEAGGLTDKSAKELRHQLEGEGYDSVILNSEATPEVAVFFPNQIKSADTVTRDATKNIIPLSQRFDETNPDIRYTQQPGTITVPLQDFHANINSVMGEGWLQQAIDLGLVEVIEGSGPNGESGSWAGGKIRLYTGSMPKGGSPAGVLLHEGKHATFADVLGDSLQEYVKDLHTLAKNGNKVAQDAITHSVLAAADTLGIKHNLLNGGNRADFENLRAIIEARRPGLLAEEELAYFVQYGTEAQGGAGFLRRLVNAIKAWFAQTRLGQRMKELGLGFELTDGMAVEWAKMGLNMSLQKAKQAAKVKARIEKQAANMPVSARLGKALEALENVDPLYSYIGANAKTANLSLLQQAKERVDAGEDAENVRQETGWFKGKDNKWRFEIDDSTIKMKSLKARGLTTFNQAKLGDTYTQKIKLSDYEIRRGDSDIITRKANVFLLKDIFSHPELFSAYPQLKNLQISIVDQSDLSTGTNIGEYRPPLKDHPFEEVAGSEEIRIRTGLDDQKALRVLIHEVQHAIQYQAALSMGISIEQAGGKSNYKRSLGELEARDAANRLWLTAAERQVTQPYRDTMFKDGIRDEDVIVQMKTPSSYMMQQLQDEGVQTGAKTSGEVLYSMGIKELREQLWNDPTDYRLEVVNKPGLLQKLRADFVDFFAEMEKKSKDVYDTYILQRAKKGARIEKSRQAYLLPLRELIANSPWDAKEVGDMLAARHIKIDNVNTDLAQRASFIYTKELLKALPDAKRKELVKARVNVKAGKMPDGTAYKDANGNVINMQVSTKQKLMFDLMNQYVPFEIANTAGVQELNQEWEIFKDAAGGFSNGGIARGIVRTVDNVLASVSKAPAKFDEIANLFDAMNRHTLDILEEGGLITAREHARLLTSKSAYAPLRRESYNIDRETELLFQKASAGGSKQIGTRAGTANLSEPTLVLQNALAKLEATAAAAERNLANQELYNTIMTDREGWKPWFTIVDKDQYVTHDEDGFLQEKHATASNRGYIVLIKDGKKIVIKPNMHNERATGFVRAVNNMDVQTLNGPMKVMSWVNSLIRWINISASPIFLMTNLIRDPLTAAYNLQATEAAEYSKDIFLNWKRAFKALKKVYIDNNRDLTDADVKMLEKFEKAGGRTSFVLSLKEMDDNSFSNFEGQVARRQGSMKYLMKAKDTWLDGIENYNILFENIMRFSTFMTLQEKSQGKISEQHAARIAQDITTNFSRRGYKSQMLGVWWLFFNASVQGNYQVLRNLMSSKRVQVAVGGTIATAVMLDVLGRALTDDWDEIPEWDKERNIILPLKVGGDFVKIPAPWVYNVFWRMGGMIGETLAGKRKPQDTILDMAALTFTTLDPLGKPGSLAQAISPTAADPFVQILENKNFAGNPIGPEGYPGASTKANSELLWSTTPKGYQSFARFVNEATGGSAVESGKIDLRPGDYQLLADFLTGSFGKFLTDTTFGFANKLDKGIEGPKDIPIIKEFFSDPSNPMMVQKYHTNIATIYGAHRLEQMYVKGPERDLIKLQEVREKRGNELRMYAQAQDVEKQLKSLRVKLRAAQNREDTGREKELKERMNKVQEQFNKKFEQNVK